MSLHHGLRSAAGASVADPDFENVSLLLLGNGTNGGQNNTFVDGSSNAFSITRYGNTTQGTFSPFGYNWSNYFDGNGDYLSESGSSGQYAFGTGNFTVEFWLYALDVTSRQGLYSNNTSATSTGPVFAIRGISTTGCLGVGSVGNADNVQTADNAIYANQWHHIALVRSGTGSNQTKIYVDGVEKASGTLSDNYTVSREVNIGRTVYYGENFKGYISSLRILKGTAQYTSNFTPPTAPLTAITNTSLLTCQSNRFIDNSSNAFTITPYGDAKVTNFAPFATGTEYSTGTNGGSGYFDGSGDYLSVADNAALEVGSGDFTLETWVYYRGPNPANGANIVSKGNSSSFGPYAIGVNPTSNKVEALCSFTGSTWNITLTSSATLPTNTWTHLAFVRSGSTFTLYVNGTSNATTTSSSSLVDNTENLLVGKTNFTTTEFPGYITDVRLVKGTAVYSGSSFTVPTAPLTAITNTSLLLNFTNASIIDSTGKNDLETVGDAQISTSVKKYGTGSLKFDGTGDYLQIANSSAFNLGSSNFTVEAWIYPTTSGVARQIIAKNQGAYPGGYEMNFLVNESNDLQFAAYGTSLFYASSTATISTNTWTHVAAVRNGSTITLYINGVADGTVTAQTIQTTTSDVTIGRDLESNGGGRYFTGYIDDLRITKGVARYTAAFTPPSRQLPAR